jgi:hypothetical protein
MLTNKEKQKGPRWSSKSTVFLTFYRAQKSIFQLTTGTVRLAYLKIKQLCDRDSLNPDPDPDRGFF